jgi:YrbI family 3-deoxy-D-manno-octulosonate 8-phosphate phosphatase
MNSDVVWFNSVLKDEVLCAKLISIKLVVLDIDGCLTDAQIYLPQHSEEIKGFSVQDGLGITMANKNNLSIAFLSGRSSETIHKRAQSLGIPDALCVLGTDEKIPATQAMQARLGVSAHETLFMGDDVLDLKTRDVVGLFVCPANGIFYVKDQADLVIAKPGGQGAVRLFLDLLFYVQGKHPYQKLIDQSLHL